MMFTGLHHRGEPKATLSFWNSEPRARPQLREHLLARKMNRWALIGRYPSGHPSTSVARARRNFSRLLARYPEIAERLGLTMLSSFPPL